MSEAWQSLDWRNLVSAPWKEQAFSQDLYLRECWDDVACLADDAVAEVDSLALLTFKPEAVPGRRMRPTLDFLTEHGFIAVGIARARYTRHSMRELWRYDWDRYTTDRLALATVMYTAGEALLLILRDVSGVDCAGAAKRLSELRGPAAAEDRRPGQLRALLHPPNEVLNFVHVADEPVDVLREIGIFLDRDERQTLLRGVFAASPPVDLGARMLNEIARLEASCAPHDLDFERSTRRVEQVAPGLGNGLKRLRDAAHHGERIRWNELCAIVSPAHAQIDVWDFIVIACGVLELWR
jgi:hypothetical protein